MPRQARPERQISAIAAALGRELADPLQLELAELAGRDRRPKLSPRIPSRKPLKRISGLYFIPIGRRPPRLRDSASRMFPRSHNSERWKQAREQPKSLILHQE